MDELTIREGILQLLAGRDDIDPSSCVTMMRTAVANVEAYLSVAHHREYDVDELLDYEIVDDVLIMATQNGHLDIFTEVG